MNEAKLLTGDDIKTLFIGRKIVHRPVKLPTDLAFQNVAIQINKLKAKNQDTRNIIATRMIAIDQAAKTLQEFLAASPRCNFDKYPYRDYPDGYFDMFVDKERLFPVTLLRDLGKFRRVMDRVSPLVESPTRKSPSSPVFWHDHLLMLEYLFTKAMRSSNPDLHIGRQAQGPLGRFLEASIPLLCDQQPTAEAAISALDNLTSQNKGRVKIREISTTGTK